MVTPSNPKLDGPYFGAKDGVPVVVVVLFKLPSDVV
jgi:hypothetical protein